MNLLAIETATNQCSVALSTSNSEPPIQRFFSGGPQASQSILEEIDALLKAKELTPKDLDLLAVGHGPGSFTGVRLACAVSQGLSLAHNLPIIPINTLDILAYQCDKPEGGYVFACIDARMGEVYGCFYHYQQDQLVPMGPVQHHPINNFPKPKSITQVLCIGNIKPEPMPSWIKEWRPLDPQASTLIKIAVKASSKDYLKTEELTPLYIRNQVTH
jgi:tRNA threonylcarbamoyladenosine biosynthesis protein TsaB